MRARYGMGTIDMCHGYSRGMKFNTKNEVSNSNMIWNVFSYFGVVRYLALGLSQGRVDQYVTLFYVLLISSLPSHVSAPLVWSVTNFHLPTSLLANMT